MLNSLLLSQTANHIYRVTPNLTWYHLLGNLVTMNKQPRLSTTKHAVAARRYQIEMLYSQGLSTYQVADKLGIKADTVKHNLWQSGKIRKALGTDIEVEVAAWLSNSCKALLRLPGDHPYDLLVDGQRIDVKSSKINASGGYSFEITHKNAKPKIIYNHMDWLYLVFITKTAKLIYKADPRIFTGRRVVYFKADISQSIYPLQYLGSMPVAVDEGEVTKYK